MSTLSEIRVKYNLTGGKYDPNPACKHCRGTGERHVKKLNRDTFCICLFVAPEASDEMGDMLGSVAKQQLKQLEEARNEE